MIKAKYDVLSISTIVDSYFSSAIGITPLQITNEFTYLNSPKNKCFIN